MQSNNGWTIESHDRRQMTGTGNCCSLFRSVIHGRHCNGYHPQQAGALGCTRRTRKWLTVSPRPRGQSSPQVLFVQLAIFLWQAVSVIASLSTKGHSPALPSGAHPSTWRPLVDTSSALRSCTKQVCGRGRPSRERIVRNNMRSWPR